MKDIKLEQHLLTEDQLVEFWFSDETRPFLSIYCSKLVVHTTYVDVYNIDYTNPIVSVSEYDYFSIIDAESQSEEETCDMLWADIIRNLHN